MSTKEVEQLVAQPDMTTSNQRTIERNEKWVELMFIIYLREKEKKRRERASYLHVWGESLP